MDRPLAQGSEALGRDAHPAVDDRRLLARDRARQLADHLRVDARDRCCALGAERRDQLGQAVEPVDVRRRAGQALGEQHLQHRQQHRGVGAGAHEVVLVGDLGGLGAPRVDDDHPAFARLEVTDALGEVGHGHQRAVGGHRVGTDDHEQLGAVEVGDRDHQLVAEELPRHELVGHLVDGGGAEAVLGAQRAHEPGPVGAEAERVGVGVAEVDPHRVAALGRDRRGQPVGDQVERLVPAHLDPGVAVRALHAPHGAAQPVGVGVHVGERDALGTDVAARQRVGGVAPDAGHLAVLEGQLQAADGLAQVAHAVARAGEAEGDRWLAQDAHEVTQPRRCTPSTGKVVRPRLSGRVAAFVGLPPTGARPRAQPPIEVRMSTWSSACPRVETSP
ncbi:MAG: hypothetical protein JWN84_1417 [Nocardioides sp.]|nr:hypothetical protein [Nocardioides sp.]